MPEVLERTYGSLDHLEEVSEDDEYLVARPNVATKEWDVTPCATFDREQSHFMVPGKEGDIKYTWDASKPDEVEMAREMFEKMKDKKYTAYKKDSKEVMTAFDPEAGEIAFIGRVVGG